jgi:hypothetical protein
MAKRVNTASFKGMLHYNGDTIIIEEFGKGDEPSEFFDLRSLLEDDFAGKVISITIKEELLIPSVDEADFDDE